MGHTRDMFLLSAALCLVSVIAAPTPFMISAPTALAAAPRPVPPKHLPAEYRRVDSRIPYQYYRQTLYPCTGPDDEFSCANLTSVKEPNMKRVFYKDHKCQRVLRIDNDTVQIPMDGPSYRNDSSCQSHSASCSRSWHPGKCTTYDAWCPVEGANKTVCDDWNRANPHPGGDGYISCHWRPAGGYFEGIQQYQAIEEPNKRGSNSKSK